MRATIERLLTERAVLVSAQRADGLSRRDRIREIDDELARRRAVARYRLRLDLVRRPV